MCVCAHKPTHITYHNPPFARRLFGIIARVIGARDDPLRLTLRQPDGSVTGGLAPADGDVEADVCDGGVGHKVGGEAEVGHVQIPCLAPT